MTTNIKFKSGTHIMLIFFQLAFRLGENKPHKHRFIWVVLHLLLASITAAPTAHADEPPPFSKLCKEEHQGEVVRYENEPNEDGFSSTFANICFNDNNEKLFVDFRDYSPSLNSCKWRVILDKQGDSYYKKTDECEVTLTLQDDKAKLNFPHRCDHLCGVNAYFYNVTLTREPPRTLEKPKLTLLQNHSEICEGVMPQLEKKLTPRGIVNIGAFSYDFEHIRLEYGKGVFSESLYYSGWIADINNDELSDIVTFFNIENPYSINNDRMYLLYTLTPNESEKTRKKYSANYRKTKKIIESKIPQMRDIKLGDNILGKSVKLLVSHNKTHSFEKFSSKVITYQSKQYILVYGYQIKNADKNEINLLDLKKDFKNYQNLCNYQITI